MYIFFHHRSNLSQLARAYGIKGTTGNIVAKEYLESQGIDLSKYKTSIRTARTPQVRRRLRRMLGKIS